MFLKRINICRFLYQFSFQIISIFYQAHLISHTQFHTATSSRVQHNNQIINMSNQYTYYQNQGQQQQQQYQPQEYQQQQNQQQEQPKTFSQWLWGCCRCPQYQSFGMDVEATPGCPNCGHFRCLNCPTEEVERRATEQINGPSGSGKGHSHRSHHHRSHHDGSRSRR